MNQYAEHLSSIVLEPHHIVATSGTCHRNPGPGGWGAVIFDLVGQCLYEEDELFGANWTTTNNVMELTAAAKALAAIEDVHSPIVVTSHSQYLVKGMTEWVAQWRERNWRRADGKPVTNREQWQAILDAVGERNVLWKWLPEEEARSENERATLLAKLALNRMLT